jgi:hypothetical protein
MAFSPGTGETRGSADLCYELNFYTWDGLDQLRTWGTNASLMMTLPPPPKVLVTGCGREWRDVISKLFEYLDYLYPHPLPLWECTASGSYEGKFHAVFCPVLIMPCLGSGHYTCEWTT